MDIKLWGGSSAVMDASIPELHLEIDGEHWVVTDGPKLIKVGTPQEIAVALTVSEIELLDSALDSFEYWEHRDQLPHNSGHITVEDQDDFLQQRVDGLVADEEEVDEAWEAVKDARALARKLFEART